MCRFLTGCVRTYSQLLLKATEIGSVFQHKENASAINRHFLNLNINLREHLYEIISCAYLQLLNVYL